MHLTHHATILQCYNTGRQDWFWSQIRSHITKINAHRTVISFSCSCWRCHFKRMIYKRSQIGGNTGHKFQNRFPCVYFLWKHPQATGVQSMSRESIGGISDKLKRKRATGEHGGGGHEMITARSRLSSQTVNDGKRAKEVIHVHSTINSFFLASICSFHHFLILSRAKDDMSLVFIKIDDPSR